MLKNRGCLTLFIFFIIIFLIVALSVYKSIWFKEGYKHQIINLVNITSNGTNINVVYNFNNIVEKIELNNITITSYNNESSQTDDSPNIMASNRLVYEGAIAISRDLKTKYNLKWGDIIYVKTLQRYFIIEDLMNKRFNNRLDIFSFDKNWSKYIHLKNEGIIIYKVKR